MGASQFIVAPSETKVATLFVAATGRSLIPEVCWKSWNPVSTQELEVFRQYIRPSHQKILNDTISGKQKSPCVFLRQILRPHTYRIESSNAGWVLRKGLSSEEAHGVRIGPGKTVMWADADGAV